MQTGFGNIQRTITNANDDGNLPIYIENKRIPGIVLLTNSILGDYYKLVYVNVGEDLETKRISWI